MALEKEILKEYLNVTHEISRQFRNHYGKVNLTFPQAMVLSLLESEGSMPISSLAERMGSANSTISGVIDRLERMGFVCRKRSDMDRRVIYVEVTDRWQEVRNKTATSVSGFFGGMLEDLSAKEQETILDGLKLLSRVLDEKPEER